MVGEFGVGCVYVGIDYCDCYVLVVGVLLLGGNGVVKGGVVGLVIFGGVEYCGWGCGWVGVW